MKLNNTSEIKRDDPNKRLRGCLSLLSGAYLLDNIIMLFAAFSWITYKKDIGFNDNVTYPFKIPSTVEIAFLIISSFVALFYCAGIFTYLYKKKQDGAFLIPMSIFGAV